MGRYIQFSILLLLLVMSSVAVYGKLNVTDKDINDVSNNADWLAYSKNHNEQRFSELTDVNTKTHA